MIKISRFLTSKKDGSYLEEIESMEVCKWKINEICCNDRSDCLGDYPYPSKICNSQEIFMQCPYYEKEDGIIKKEEK